MTLSDIQQARERLNDESDVQTTPVEISRTLDDKTGAKVFPKMEHLQRTGSFKTRGIYNRFTKLGADNDEAVDRAIVASARNRSSSTR